MRTIGAGTFLLINPRFVKPLVKNAAPENAGGLEISGLTVTGHVDAINLNIRPGECVGLAGLAGSGKDHVAEVVAGLLNPTSGEVSIDGVRAPTGNVEAMRAAGVGFVPRDRHHRAIFPRCTVRCRRRQSESLRRRSPTVRTATMPAHTPASR